MNTVASLAALVEQLTKTPKKLDKAALVASYLAQLENDDLALAVTFLAAQPFAQTDRRRLHMGSQGLLAALATASGRHLDELRALKVTLGDVPQVAAQTLAQNLGENITLSDLAQRFADLAALSRPLDRQAYLAQLLSELNATQAQLVVGIVAKELRMGLRAGAIEDAIARAFGATLQQVQQAIMLEGDLGLAAQRARDKTLGQAQMRLFHPLSFMLATPTDKAQITLDQLPPRYVVEDKFDGIRVQAHIDAQERVLGSKDDAFLPGKFCRLGQKDVRVALFTRTHDDVTEAFAELIEPLAQLYLAQTPPCALILDGELLAIKGHTVLPFSALQRRLGRKSASVALRKEVPVSIIAFDVLHAQKELCIDQPWHVRRSMLEKLPLSNMTRGPVRRADSIWLDSIDQLEQAFTAARQRGHEGLIVKHPQASYKPGRRGRDWLKMKRPQATLDVVVTSVEVGHGRRHSWLSDYTFAVRTSDHDDTLVTVGKAYSGLTDQELAEMSVWFKAHTRQIFAHGKVRTVEPLQVIEVTFDKVLRSARHKSGFALRFPRILRLRPDKSVAHIDTLTTVASLADPAELAPRG